MKFLLLVSRSHRNVHFVMCNCAYCTVFDSGLVKSEFNDELVICSLERISKTTDSLIAVTSAEIAFFVEYH